MLYRLENVDFLHHLALGALLLDLVFISRLDSDETAR